MIRHPHLRPALLAAAAAAAVLFASSAASAYPFEQPPLPYAEDALAPTISARTVELHYGVHHAGYYDTLNELAAGTEYEELASLEEVIRRARDADDREVFDNAGQAWNHDFYWAQFAAGPVAPDGAFLDAVEAQYGGLDALKDEMVAASEDVFGTGWVWLVATGGDADGEGASFEILALQDAGNPIAEDAVPIVGIDVWEHAYYLDYENRRTDHVRAVLDGLVNWQFAGEQFQGTGPFAAAEDAMQATEAVEAADDGADDGAVEATAAE